MNKIGIMLGRLSPYFDVESQIFPSFTWKEEFLRAKELKLNSIDWVLIGDNIYQNPILTKEGIEEIRDLVSETKIQVDSVCAQYFINHPFLRCSNSELKERLYILDMLIEYAYDLNIQCIEIPFLDNSAIRNTKELKKIVNVFKSPLDNAHQYKINLAFETSLSPIETNLFLSKLNHPAAKIVYDTGNSAAMGYNPIDELNSYWKDIIMIHIKDRVLNGQSVFLGQGDTDFSLCFNLFKEINYYGSYIIESKRNRYNKKTIKNDIELIRYFLKDA